MIKKLLTLVAVLLFLFIIVYTYYRTTPYYSLAQITKAFKAHDVKLAKEYIDIDSLSEQLSEAVIKSAEAELNKPSTTTNEWEKLGEEWGKQIAEAMLPSIKTKIKDATQKTFTDSIEGKKTDDKNVPAFETYTWKDFLPGGRIKLSSDGKLEKLTINTDKKNNIVFSMKNKKSKWVIFSWSNISDIIKNQPTDLTNQSSTKPTQQKKFGGKTDIASEWFITILSPSEYIPSNEFERADEGNKLISIEVIYENNSNIEGTYDPSNFILKDEQDHQFNREYTGKTPQLESGTLLAKQKVRGFITYKVPQTTTSFSVIYSSSAGGTVIFK